VNKNKNRMEIVKEVVSLLYIYDKRGEVLIVNCKSGRQIGYSQSMKRNKFREIHDDIIYLHDDGLRSHLTPRSLCSPEGRHAKR
jgi:hypothetical protein